MKTEKNFTVSRIATSKAKAYFQCKDYNLQNCRNFYTPFPCLFFRALMKMIIFYI